MNETNNGKHIKRLPSGMIDGYASVKPSHSGQTIDCGYISKYLDNDSRVGGRAVRVRDPQDLRRLFVPVERG